MEEVLQTTNQCIARPPLARLATFEASVFRCRMIRRKRAGEKKAHQAVPLKKVQRKDTPLAIHTFFGVYLHSYLEYL